MSAKIFFGYFLTVFAGKMKVPDSDYYLAGPNNEPIVAEWNGLRLGVSAIYVLGKSAERK
ncbi:MAG: hypothetical protein WKF87_13175 [Chryseolinea sp.]